jgi:hypothetical protein
MQRQAHLFEEKHDDVKKKRKPLTTEQKERRAAINRAWREANKERLVNNRRAWREANKEHCAATNRARREANKERIVAVRRAYLEANPERSLYRVAEQRARKRGIAFNLTLADIVVPERCPVFGIVLQRGKGVAGPASPTLDRIDASRGYVKGNVAVISNYANILKGQASAAQHLRIAEWMKEVSS